MKNIICETKPAVKFEDCPFFSRLVEIETAAFNKEKGHKRQTAPKQTLYPWVDVCQQHYEAPAHTHTHTDAMYIS